MYKIIVASHGPMAQGMKESLEFVMGPAENVSALCLDGEGISKFTENAATATGKLKNMMAIYWPYNYDELQVNSNLKQNPAYPEAGDSYESTGK